ncbi:MAG: PaaI family thioesterase [Nannocystaceae bacterium]
MASHFHKLERMYLDAPTNARHEALTMKISKGSAIVSARVSPALHHAGGTVHGSYLFELLDDAAFFAASSVVEDFFIVTVSFSIQFLRRVEEGTIIATGTLTKPSRSVLFADAVLIDEAGRVIAKGSGTFARSSFRLGDVPSYSRG